MWNKHSQAVSAVRIGTAARATPATLLLGASGMCLMSVGWVREHGVGLHRAVIDAGLVRLRPVLVTVLATVGGLIPLAIEGGPMWRQLVYVQIGGLLLATLVTKGVVPLLYVVFTEKFKLIRWEREEPDEPDVASGHTLPLPAPALRSSP